MTKKEAAAALGLSERGINRHVEAGRLNVTYQKVAGRTVALFDAAEVDTLKEKAQAPWRPIETKSAPQTALTRRDVKGGELVQLLMRLAGSTESGRPRASDFDSQLTLSLNEAAIVARQSRASVRQAIKDGKLKAAIRGRGWNIKRSDLEAWIKKL